MEVLKLKPASAPKIQKARCGKPFTPGNHHGQKRNDLPAQPKVCEKLDNLEKCEDNKSVTKQSEQKEHEQKKSHQGDASVELDDTPYKEWLAAQGLIKLKNEGANIHKIDDLVKGTKKDESAKGDDVIDSKEDDGAKGDKVINDSANKDVLPKEDKTKVMILDKM